MDTKLREINENNSCQITELQSKVSDIFPL